MIVNSINTLSTNKAYSLGSNQQQSSIANSQSFGSAPAVQQKVASHSGKVAKAVLAAVVLGTAALFSTACSQPTGGSSPIEEPIEPTEPTQTLARQTMNTMIDIASALGLEKSSVLSNARTVSYIPVTGDIENFSYHNGHDNSDLSYNLNTKSSTSNALVYDLKVTDQIGDISLSSVKVTKSKDGLLVNIDNSDTSSEYVQKEGYIMKYKVEEGVKKEFCRIYPKDSTGAMLITSPDGTKAYTYSNVAIDFAN